LFAAALVVTTFLAIMILRSALDIMTWLSPYAFIDAGLELAKLLATGLLVLLAVIAPKPALLVDVTIAVITVLLVRWSMRAAVMGAIIAWDLSFGRLGPATRFPRRGAKVGPFVAFVIDCGAWKPRQACKLELREDQWFVRRPRAWGPQEEVCLGAADSGTLVLGSRGVEVEQPEGRVLLPPRYRGLAAELYEATRAKVQSESGASVVLRRAAATALRSSGES
jgi:hypothetical protein